MTLTLNSVEYWHMKNTSGVSCTWKQLRDLINTFNDELLNQLVPIAVIPNGEMEMLNGVNFVGNDRAIDVHISDINDEDFPTHTPYLVAGISQ